MEVVSCRTSLSQAGEIYLIDDEINERMNIFA